MVKIRFKCLGSKFNVCYKIVVVDVCVLCDGRFIEVIGEYNFYLKVFRINEEVVI